MTQFIKIILLIAIVAIFTTILTFYLSGSTRHQWGADKIEAYPVSVKIIENQDFITDMFLDGSISTSPTFGMVSSHVMGTNPDYLMTIDVEGKQLNDKQEVISKKGQVQMSFYSPPEENSPTSYTLSWTVDGQSRDVFGQYDGSAADSNKNIQIIDGL